MGKKAEVTLDAEIEQKEQLIDTLNVASKELQSKVKSQKKVLTDVDKAIDDAFKEKEKQFDVSVEELRGRERVFSSSKSDHDAAVNSFNKDVEDFEAYKEREGKKLAQQGREVDTGKQEVKEKSIALENKSADLKKREKVASKTLEEAKSITEQNNEKIVAAEKAVNDLDAKKNDVDILIRRQKEKEIEFADREKAIAKTREDDLLFSSSLKRKEEELIELKKKIDSTKVANSKDAESIKQRKEDAIVSSKKNQVESTRLKNLEKDLNNREAKLTDRENLFKENVSQ